MQKLSSCNRGTATPMRRPRTIDEFLQDKGTKPKENDLPDGVVRLGDLIQDFLSTHNK